MKHKKVFIDANLSVLLIVGLTDKRYIEAHKRLQDYDVVDFELFFSTIGRHQTLGLSPNILTEVSNLIRHIGDPMRSKIANTLAVLTRRHPEIYIASNLATARPEYLSLGLADAVLLELLTQQGGRLYTADSGLHRAALDANLDAVNFNHIRDQRPDFQ